uniref:Peptidase S1 domain-containing protein n=1 Tax=Panagrellus redivivus TaxID=6233 RepID=A0A7E4V4G5_PANRE
MKVSTGLCVALLTFSIVCVNASIVPDDLVITPDECKLAEGREIHGRCIVDPRNIPETKPGPKAQQVPPKDAAICPETPYNATGDNGFRPLTAAENYYVQSVCGIGEEPRTRIQNGRIAKRNQFPWAIFRWCSAVLISPRHILTAAHCVYNRHKGSAPCSAPFEKDIINQTANYGGTCVKKDQFCPQGFDMKSATIARVIFSREKHEPGCIDDNDIALILLNEDIELDDSVKPICISKLHPSNLIQLKDLGFGSVDSYHESSVLRYMTTRIIKIRSYREVVTKGVDIGDGFPQVRRGDSGGPLQATFNGSSRTYLAGLHSRGADYMISTYVPAYADWICQLTGVCELD